VTSNVHGMQTSINETSKLYFKNLLINVNSFQFRTPQKNRIVKGFLYPHSHRVNSIALNETIVQPANQADEQVDDRHDARSGPDAQRATYVGQQLPETKRLTVLDQQPTGRVRKFHVQPVVLTLGGGPVPNLFVTDNLHPAGRAIV